MVLSPFVRPSIAVQPKLTRPVVPKLFGKSVLSAWKPDCRTGSQSSPIEQRNRPCDGAGTRGRRYKACSLRAQRGATQPSRRGSAKPARRRGLYRYPRRCRRRSRAPICRGRSPSLWTIDICVTNAGGPPAKPFVDTTMAESDNAYELNLRSMFRLHTRFCRICNSGAGAGSSPSPRLLSNSLCWSLFSRTQCVPACWAGAFPGHAVRPAQHHDQ